MYEDEASLVCALCVALFVCGLKAELCTVKVVVGEEESAKIVQICDSFACRVE